MLKTIVISPSGNLYGSENVLFDFLRASRRKYIVYSPSKSSFQQKLEENSIVTKSFSNIKLLYLEILLRLIFKNENVFLNEGGHIRYIKVLSRLLPFRKFVVAIRLLEDCNKNLINLPKNIQLIAVSDYIKNHIPNKSTTVYDPYTLKNLRTDQNYQEHNYFRIGIVGRVSESKGLDNLIPIAKKISNETLQKTEFVFYGSYDDEEKWFQNFCRKLRAVRGLKYWMPGFFANHDEIYSNVDIIIHLNRVEPLGRIVFEAVDYGVPVIAFNAGGVGELGVLLGLENMLIDETNDWVKDFNEKILSVRNCPNQFENVLSNAKKIIGQTFSAKQYSREIEKMFKD